MKTPKLMHINYLDHIEPYDQFGIQKICADMHSEGRPVIIFNKNLCVFYLNI